MVGPIVDTTTLCASSACVVRPQDSHYLFYNVRTDELHLLSPSAFYVVQLCDGLRSVGDIEALLASGLGHDLELVRAHTRPFLENMLSRGVLELDRGD